MGILFGFAPWIVYWVLVGNVPFTTAVLVALAIAVLALVIGRVKGAPGRTLEIGAVGTFLVLTVLTFTLSQSFMERWMQPLSNAGIFLVALTGVLVGKPFVREFAEVGRPAEVVKSEEFGRITTLLTWIWVAAFAGMTVSSSIPPIVQGDATILDTKTPLSFVCYWVIPFSLLGLAALASRILPDRMAAGSTTSSVRPPSSRSPNSRSTSCTTSPRNTRIAKSVPAWRHTTSRSGPRGFRWWETTRESRGPRLTRFASGGTN